MRYSWTSEPHGYSLRDGRGYTIALVIHEPNGQRGYCGGLLERDLPTSAVFRSQADAGAWVVAQLIEREVIAAESTFSEFPFKRGQH